MTQLPTFGPKELLRRARPWKFAALGVVTVLNSFISLTFALITTWASHLSGTSTTASILWFCAKGLMLYVAVYIGLYLTEIVTNSILREACLHLEADCMKHYLGATGTAEDEIVSLVSQDIRMVRQDYFVPMLTLPTYICRAVIPIVYLLTQNVLVGACFAIGAALMMIPQRLLSGRQTALGAKFSDQREKSLSTVVDVTKGNETVRNNQAEPFFLNLIHDRFNRTERAEERMQNMQALMFSLSGPIKGIADVVPFTVGILLMRLDPKITIILLVAMLGTAGTLKGEFQEIVYLTGDLSQTKAVRAKIAKLLNRPMARLTEKTAVPPLTALCADHVTYQTPEAILLKDVTLRFNAGEKILITGESGAGKSTLLNLLMQSKTPTEGTVYGLDYHGNQVEHIHNAIGLVAQQPHLFNLSIRDNLTLGQPADDDTLLALLDRVQLRSQLGPDPLARQVEDNGKNLSGGQRVKIEIARALFTNKPIIFADELTANLDEPTARSIRAVLLDLPVMVVEVAHHFDSTDRYDHVYRIADQTVQAVD